MNFRLHIGGDSRQKQCLKGKPITIRSVDMSAIELVQYDIVNISNVYIILLYHLLVTFLT